MPGNCLTYTLRQLAPRDEIVFKSVVNVLHGKTRHQWQHTGAADADLVVLGSQGEARATPVMPGHAVIQVFTDHSDHGPQALSLPLRIADVIQCLDRAGDEVRRQSPRPLAAPGSQPAAAPAGLLATSATPVSSTTAAIAAPPQMAQAQPQPVPQPDAQPEPAVAPTPAMLPTRAATPQAAGNGGWHRVSLLRWPDPALLQEDLRFIKLATVMTGHPLTLPELAARTQFPPALCHRFVAALQDRGLLRVTGDLPPVVTVRPAQSSAPQGLLARIRARLEMIVRAPATK